MDSFQGAAVIIVWLPGRWPVAGPEFQMRVDFRAVQVAMPEELLHVPQAGAATQQMRRARETKGVHRGFHSSLQRIVADALGDHLI